ncbi:MAG: hypothetical protein V9G18_00005 [Albidovulum sp.]
MATSLNLFDPQGSSPAGERAAIPGAARPADARPPAANPAEPGPPEARSAARVPAVARSASTAPLDRFAVLLGREPSGPELAEFVRVRDALGLRDNDALWLVLLALQHQRRQLEQSIDNRRREFEAAVDRRLEKAQATADALVESAKTRFLEQFPAALKAAARKVSIRARAGHEPAMVAGLLAGLALLAAGAGGASWLAYALGEWSGYERGERAGFDKGVLTARADTAPASKPPAPTVRGR